MTKNSMDDAAKAAGRTPAEFAPENAPRPYKAEILAELIELDRDLMKLLVRRAKLVNKLRAGKEHAATPAAARAEKDVRAAWEKNAASFSRDDKFARQLFTLLQELRVDSRSDAESRGAFNLAPVRKPVAVAMPGLLSVNATRMLAVLAAWLNNDFALENVVLNDPLMDCVKALNNAGAKFSWSAGARPGEGRLAHAVGPREVNLATDKALYIGEDPFNMYLLAFLAAGRTGRARFTGGSGLKMADFSPLRRFLPELGARLAHSVPKSNGLPANVEASGVLPDHIVVPADLPREGLAALFCAAAAWKRKLSIDCANVPQPMFAAVFAECAVVLRDCSVKDAIDGTVVTLDAGEAALPQTLSCPLDPALSAYMLSLPVFAGGSVALSGVWNASSPREEQAARLLAAGGLAVRMESGEIGATPDPTATQDKAIDLREADASLIPLGLALAARAARKSGKAVPLPLLADDADMGLVESFVSHVGLAVRDGKLITGNGEEKTPWTCPSALWAFAFALCAYDVPNIGLTNPTVTTALMPSFWAFYNALPNPSEARKAPEKQEKPRRRIITE
ncbi:chorismate mutase [Desulfovibrio sp. OttesenSCG-928-O18]|nr:chorismate mutase [Desulfovibrio sp. OttesenSCG-928-O18]